MKKIVPISLKNKFSQFSETWTPKIIGELNNQYVKICKLKGDFVWHSHKDEDELFHVIKGKLKMQYRDKSVEVLPGEIIIVPKGVEHCPSAEEETWILLFEPISTKHTGDVVSEITKNKYPKI